MDWMDWMAKWVRVPPTITPNFGNPDLHILIYPFPPSICPEYGSPNIQMDWMDRMDSMAKLPLVPPSPFR